MKRLAHKAGLAGHLPVISQRKEQSREHFPFYIRFGHQDLMGNCSLFGKATMLRMDPLVGLAMRSLITGLIMLIWVIVTEHIQQLFRIAFATGG